MKRIVLVLCVLCMGASLWAGGQQSGGAAKAGSDGLTPIKMWGTDQQRTWGGNIYKLSDLISGKNTSRYWTKLNEEVAKLGLKFDMTLIAQDQMATAFQTLLASGQYGNYDWVVPIDVPNELRLNLVEQGRLIAINKAIDQYSNGNAKRFYTQEPAGYSYFNLEKMEDGNVYWLSQNSYGNPDIGSPRVIMIRKDWLDKLGLKVPTTLDEFFNTVKAFRDRDANGNGIRDEVVSVGAGMSIGIPQWFGLGHELVAAVDGKAQSPWYQPGMREYLQFMNRLYKEGLLLISSGETGDWEANRVGVMEFYGRESYYLEPMVGVPAGAAKPLLVPVVIQANPNIKAQVVDDDIGTSLYLNSYMITIPAGNKNIANTMKFLDYATTEDYWLLVNYGIEGYSFSRTADNTYTIFRGTEGVDPLMSPSEIQFLWRAWQAILPTATTAVQSGWRVPRDLGYEPIAKSLNDQGVDGESRRAFFNDYWAKKWPLIPVQGSVLTFPTKAEIQREAAIMTDLNTYSTELATAIIMGEKGVDNASWNTYLADLKRLGLDEAVNIFQAKMNRAKK
ncbi:sugar ABC transporter permease [Spirochaetia bacterium]|nr:sugar ABC transporter permease [Spirochaetia bacterium]